MRGGGEKPFMQNKCLHGFTYAEIIIGIAIISFILVGMNGIFGIGIRNNKKAENVIIALGLAQELMEQMDVKVFNNISSTKPENIGAFTRNTVVTPNYNNDVNRKLVKVTASGPDIPDVYLTCIVTNPVL